ncbi:hypothetical protein M0802_001441 [Mischocyttarus mexicanus]|nr:hypothetical protein M0802_001441 [Mischocyttarus mexicanus]
MGERKGTNLYYPPDYDPRVGGINKFLGTHALRERARKLHMGILIIRFEMPYNIWCNGCGNHIGMGVRYNAEKTKIGMYYSTPLYQFRMKCHLCDNHFEIKTDPGNLDYVIVSGARRQENRWDPKENEQIVPETKEVSHRLYDDAMYKLEHKVEDKKIAKSRDKALESAIFLNDAIWKDDYSSNYALRSAFRAKEKELKKKQESQQSLLNKYGLKMNLVEEDANDILTSKILTHNTRKEPQRTAFKTRLPLKHFVSLIRDKNAKITSQSLVKKKTNLNKQILPKVNTASSSKINTNISTSLVSYDGSSTDTEG